MAMYGGLIIDVERSGIVLRETTLPKNGTHVLGGLGGTDGPNELSFSGACGDGGLKLRPASENTRPVTDRREVTSVA